MAADRSAPTAADGGHADDLLAGVRIPAATPLGIEVAADTWLRQEDSGRALMVGLCGFVAVFCAVPVIGYLALIAPQGRFGDLPVALGFAAVSGLFGWIGVRRARAGVLIGDRGVCLRGLLRTWPLPLHEVDRFETGVLRSPPGLGEIGVRVVCRDGRRLDIWAMAAGAAAGVGQEESEAALQPLCDELNRVLNEQKGEPWNPNSPPAGSR